MLVIRNLIDGIVLLILAGVEMLCDWLHGYRRRPRHSRLVIKFGVDTSEFDNQMNRINEMNWRWRVPPPEPEPVQLPAPWDDPWCDVGGEA